MCCSTIRISLNGVVKDQWVSKAGTYQKANGKKNNRSYWTKIDGDQVSCGRHRASSCKECPSSSPSGNDASWCNGDCIWKNNECQSNPSFSGSQALWYDNIYNRWIIGVSRSLGSSNGAIYTSKDTACPTTSDNLWKYVNLVNGEYLLAPNNFVSIQCVF